MALSLSPRAAAAWPAVAAALSGALYAAAFPPFNLAEAAYLFPLPFLFWSLRRPGWKGYAGAAYGSAWAAWFVLLYWLRHVTWPGLLALVSILALFHAGWLLAARWALPRMVPGGFVLRVLGVAGLAGLWAGLEYLRGVIFTGCPWLPLAASQWNRPALLQLLAFTGSYGLGAVLIAFPFGLLFYVLNLRRPSAGRPWWGRLCPEFYAAFALVLGAFALFFTTGGLEQRRREEPLFRAGVVQPYIPQLLKWDAGHAREILRVLERHTGFAAAMGVDVILWPEAVTPAPVKRPEGLNLTGWTYGLVDRAGVPVLMGNLAVERERPGGGEGDWYNMICTVAPGRGLLEPYYAKRHLVPFGEYVPLERLLFFLRQIVPIGDFVPGDHHRPVPLPLGDGRNLRAGALVCYEDAFAGLARDAVREGADFLYVATNDAWYGEEGGAYQHAVHSVLRAVETRRPVVRCGNGGWSGWIDAYGNIRHLLVRPGKGVYFRGVEAMDVFRDPAWAGRESFYVRHGDWFVALGLAAAAGGWFRLRRESEGESESESESEREGERERGGGGELRPGMRRVDEPPSP